MLYSLFHFCERFLPCPVLFATCLTAVVINPYSIWKSVRSVCQYGAKIYCKATKHWYIAHPYCKLVVPMLCVHALLCTLAEVLHLWNIQRKVWPVSWWVWKPHQEWTWNGRLHVRILYCGSCIMIVKVWWTNKMCIFIMLCHLFRLTILGCGFYKLNFLLTV